LAGLLEDHHLRMIVNREGLFGELGIKTPWPNLRIGCERFDQLKAQAALEHARFSCPVTPHHILLSGAADQAAVVFSGERITLGNARCRAPLPS
jgi:dihydroorotase-like cyclic amidohydrolase